jgi:hypothetical protein
MSISDTDAERKKRSNQPGSWDNDNSQSQNQQPYSGMTGDGSFGNKNTQGTSGTGALPQQTGSSDKDPTLTSGADTETMSRDTAGDTGNKNNPPAAQGAAAADEQEEDDDEE